MPSSADIITYIGVPLAVLGVLPILYTFILAILTRNRIKGRLLHYGHKATSSSRPHDGFSIRSSPMSSLTEVELPRYTIAPLDRHTEEYWKIRDAGYLSSEERRSLLHRSESALIAVEEGRVSGFLQGGSWRTFHWRKLVVGKKLYRIQYEDELKEPPAEIEFIELINFLLDWGAVPDSTGWEKLHTGGLWTPAGTVLLRRPENGEVVKQRADWVLRTSVPEDSDGVLTLSVRWRSGIDNDGPDRDSASLSPGWGRLSEPTFGAEQDSEDGNKSIKPLHVRVREAKQTTEKSHHGTSFRFRVEDNKISKVFFELGNIETGDLASAFTSENELLPSQWFTAATAAAMTATDQYGSLWGYELPESISAFALRESVPCGVMVLYGILNDSDVPEWSSEVGQLLNGYNSVHNPASVHHNDYMAQMAARRLEDTMPPEQARVHRQTREAEERRKRMNRMQQDHYERLEREERRWKEAIASPRMSHRVVAEACVKWLIKQKHIDPDWTVEQLARAVLYLLVLDQKDKGPAADVVRVLTEWTDWSNAGGMKRKQLQLMGDLKFEFCYTACLVAVIADAAGRPKRGGIDMLECVKAWRKVRIG